MARRRKRASMREGPLADLFRSTSDDLPEDPPEAPIPGNARPRSRRQLPPSPPSASEAPAGAGQDDPYAARFGRRDPVERSEPQDAPPSPSPSHRGRPSPLRTSRSRGIG